MGFKDNAHRCAAFVFALCALASTSAAERAPSITGAWLVQGRDGTGTDWLGHMQLIHDGGPAITGRIAWRGYGGRFDGAYGTEIVRGHLLEGGKMITFSGENLLKSFRLGLANYTGRFNSSATTVSGTWKPKDQIGDGDDRGAKWHAIRCIGTG